MFLMSDLEVLESGRPCTEREILDAECMLGFSLPTELRNAYLNANGFTGPSEARFLYPLVRREAFSSVTMLRLTQVLRRCRLRHHCGTQRQASAIMASGLPGA
jgi:cell wall assembly regulator SMI1